MAEQSDVDRELEVMRKVVDALAPFGSEERTWILETAESYLAMQSRKDDLDAWEKDG